MSQPPSLQELRKISLEDFHELESLTPKERLQSGVYALYAPDGALLYIGQSSSVASRVSVHKRKWDVARASCYRLDDHERRLVLEAILMLTERPRYNKALMLNLRGQVSEIRFKRQRSG